MLECISVQAQNFFLRHELDHVRSKYVSKNIMLKGASLAIATLCGFTAAFCFKKNSTTLILPIFAGFATLCATSLGLHFCSNAFWKFRAEKDADLFAAEHSTADEILAAAKYVEATTPSSPSTYWLEGYPNARTRGAYLREIAQRKQGSIIIN